MSICTYYLLVFFIGSQLSHRFLLNGNCLLYPKVFEMQRFPGRDTLINSYFRSTDNIAVFSILNISNRNNISHRRLVCNFSDIILSFEIPTFLG